LVKRIILFIILCLLCSEVAYNNYTKKLNIKRIIMADPKIAFDKMIPYEGGYVNDVADSGGATNMGVTLAAWRTVPHPDLDHDGDVDADDVKLITKADALFIYIRDYWNRWRANEIKNQSIAEVLVNWVWGSGKWGIEIPQQLLGVEPDGKVGQITLDAVNNYQNQRELFDKIKVRYLKFIDDIIASSIRRTYSDLITYNSTKVLPKDQRREYITKQLAQRYTGDQFTLSSSDIIKYTNKRFEKGWKRRINSFTYAD
jgi:hypothetical protein